jgi:cyclic pyranopterin phosphate synthase
MNKLTHFDEIGRSRMVDVTSKSETVREAIAKGSVYAKPETLRLIEDKQVAKGDVLEVARLAGIMAAKRTGDLIPLCHPIPITSIEVDLSIIHSEARIGISSRVQTVGRTGVEMEALTAVCVAALTVYDMCKNVDRGITISEIRLIKKSGGKSGLWTKS